MAPFSSDDSDDDSMDALDKAGSLLGRIFKGVSQASVTADNEQEKAFFRAVEANKQDKVIELIKKGVNPNCYTKSGMTALHIAARKNLSSIASLLISYGADPKRGRKDNPEHLPMNEAIDFRRADIIALLARNGGISTAFDENGWTVLHHAANKGQEELVRAFIKAGMDPNAETQNGTTPLMMAIHNHHNNLVKTLLDDPGVVSGICTYYTRTDERKHNAFHLAVSTQKTHIAKRMIELGADINTADAEGATPLWMAIDNAQTEMVKTLLKAGVDINKNDGRQLLPLHQAANDPDLSTATERIFDLLLKAGADTGIADPKSGRLPLHFAAANSEADGLVRKLINHPSANLQVEIDSLDFDGASPLHLAALHVDTQSLQMLIEAGANINRRHGQDAATPLIIAARENNTGAVRKLLAAGAAARLADTHGFSALYYAREHKNTAMIQILEESVKKELKFKHKSPSSGKTP